MRIADVLDLNKYLGCQTTGAKSGLKLAWRCHTPGMFSSDSEDEEDSGDEEYDADGQAYAEGVNPHAEVEETAAGGP